MGVRVEHCQWFALYCSLYGRECTNEGLVFSRATQAKTTAGCTQLGFAGLAGVRNLQLVFVRFVRQCLVCPCADVLSFRRRAAAHVCAVVCVQVAFCE